MSYLVAFARFQEGGRSYPFNCFRDDLKPGDRVLVDRPKKPLTLTTVSECAFLNWNCSGSVRCKANEAKLNAENRWIPQNPPSSIGILTRKSFINELLARGWSAGSAVPPDLHILSWTSPRYTTVIVAVRRYTIELQLQRGKNSSNKRETVACVQHRLAHTDFNLYEWLLQFADDFRHGKTKPAQLEPAVGSADRRTPELKLAMRRQLRKAEEARFEVGCDGIDP